MEAAEGVLRWKQPKECRGWSSRRSAAVGAAERVLKWEQPKECCGWSSRKKAAVGAGEGAAEGVLQREQPKVCWVALRGAGAPPVRGGVATSSHYERKGFASVEVAVAPLISVHTAIETNAMVEVVLAWSSCRSTRARDDGVAVAPLISVHAAIETIAMVEVVLA